MPSALLPRAILLVSAIGLLPIALSYGAAPGSMVQQLFGFPADSVNAAHIFRAVMGLYLGMITLWLAGFIRPRFAPAALLSLIAFMLGLATGRLLSFVLDGTPTPLLSAYFLLELTAGSLGIWSYRRISTA